MDQARIARKVQFGYGKAASIVGVQCAHWRPVGAGDPLTTGWPLPPLYVAFDTKFAFPFVTPGLFNQRPEYAGLFDTGQTLVGDYIVEPAMGTFFIASQETYKAGLCVQTNQTLTFTRPGPAPSGAGYYGGDETATETPLLTRWPASVLDHTKGNEGDARLPGDVRMPWVEILLPSIGVQLRSGDIVVDEQAIPQRYVLSSCELTDLGYRLTASLAAT